jgi:hypothetical protein
MMDFFFKMIQKFLEERKYSQEPMPDFEFETDDMLEDVVVTVHTDDDETYTMTVFTKDQWMMVCDISELTSQSPEEVVRGMDVSLPNVLQFGKNDFD